MQLVEQQFSGAGSPSSSMFDPQAERMSHASERARSSLRQFFAALRLPRKGQTDFQIQAIFEDGDEREQIWLSDLDFNTRPATGVVSNRPSIKTVAYRKRVPFRPDQMSDWMYKDNGRLVGGFTLPVLQATEQDRGGLFTRLKRRIVN